MKNMDYGLVNITKKYLKKLLNYNVASFYNRRIVEWIIFG